MVTYTFLAKGDLHENASRFHDSCRRFTCWRLRPNFSKDKSDVVTAGSVLVLQKDGLMMYSTASPMPPLNTYKNGKISQGMGGFGRDLAIGLSGTTSVTDYPKRKFVTGKQGWKIR